MDLHYVGLCHITEQRRRTPDVRPQHRWQPIQQAAMHVQSLLILPTKVQILAGQLYLTRVACRIKQLQTLCQRCLVVSKELPNVQPQTCQKSNASSHGSQGAACAETCSEVLHLQAESMTLMQVEKRVQALEKTMRRLVRSEPLTNRNWYRTHA